jgi:hypothetical protein
MIRVLMLFRLLSIQLPAIITISGQTAAVMGIMISPEHLTSIWQMAARNRLNIPIFRSGRDKGRPLRERCVAAIFKWLLLALGLCACGLQHPSEISRIALLAPFEGRYREVGYDAYYATRLAISEAGNSAVELLAVDDGGSVEGAVERAKALVKDPLVRIVIALGYTAADAQTQRAFGDLPVLIVGQWGSKPASQHIFMMENAHAEDSLSLSGIIPITGAGSLAAPLTGSEVVALKQFALLRADTDGVRIESSSTLPDAAFRERYLKSGLFVPEPGLLATLTYDTANMALEAMQRSDVQQALETLSYSGINGIIQFNDGYWADAPIHYYCYARPDGNNPDSSAAPQLSPC